MKLLGLLTAGLLYSAQGHKEQCVDLCEYKPEYDNFGDYLEPLSNCEKKELLPFMEQRYRYFERSKEFFDNAHDSFDEREHSKAELEETYLIYKKELLLLESEFKKTQALIFADCVSEESVQILAKHVSILSHAIEEHRIAIKYLEDEMK